MRTAVKVKPGAPLSLDYPYPDAPAPGALREVVPGVYWLRMPLPFELEHINLWLLRDGAGWTIVDCGFGSDETRALWRSIFAQHLGGRPVTRVIVTHFHPDHFGLAAWLAAEWHAPVWMSEPEFATGQAWYGGHDSCTRAAYLELFERHGLILEDEGASLPHENIFQRGVPHIPAQITPMRDGQALRINGREWQVMTGYGHSPEHAALACAELGVLIAGDMVLPRISTNVGVHPRAPDEDPLGQFLDSLARYARLPAETLVLPAHGLPFIGLRERISALQMHHQARLGDLRKACGEPRTGASVMPVLFRRVLDAQQIFFAMGETLSHVNYLHIRGQLARETGTDGIIRFVRA